jgi:hypothetical protein
LPFLFIIVMEVLNALIAEADRRAVLTPLPDRAVKCWASIYADDLVIFLHPSPRDFNCIRQMTNSGTVRRRLRPLHQPRQMHDDPHSLLPRGYPGGAAGFPLPDSGVPHKVPWCSALPVEAWPRRRTAHRRCCGSQDPHLEGRASDERWKDYSHSDHSICHPYPRFYLLQPVVVGHQTNRQEAKGVSVDRHSVSGGRCRVAWPIVCSPKEHGGLGLPDLRVLSFALRLRWEWLSRHGPTQPWELLPSRPECAVAAMFSASVSVQADDGTSARF